jgi:hypothetical protein
MSIKLIILKSGEDLISDVSEMVTDDGEKVFGYFLKKPCIVKIKDFSTKKDPEDIKKEYNGIFNIVLYPWIPLTKSKIITIPSDWVVTIVEPVSKLLNMYKDQVLEHNNDKTDSSSEQQNSIIEN